VVKVKERVALYLHTCSWPLCPVTACNLPLLHYMAVFPFPNAASFINFATSVPSTQLGPLVYARFNGGVKRPGFETECLHSPGSKVQNTWNVTSVHVMVLNIGTVALGILRTLREHITSLNHILY
jgi:hypothetical protein